MNTSSDMISGVRGDGAWTLMVFGVVAAGSAVLGSFFTDLLTAPFFVGSFLESLWVLAWVWVGTRIVLGAEAVTIWRWPCALLILFSGGACLEVLWDRLPFLALNDRELVALTAGAIGFSTSLGLRVLAGRFHWPLTAGAAGTAVFYVLARFGSRRISLLWILSAVFVGCVWIWRARPATVSDNDTEAAKPRG